MCLLPVMLVWAGPRAWLSPVAAVCGGQQSSISLHSPSQAWHSHLQLAMCRWQHLPTLLSSPEPSGDGHGCFSVLQKTVLQERKLDIWAKKRWCCVLVGSWWRALLLDPASGPSYWKWWFSFPRNSIPACWGPIWISLFVTVKNLRECPRTGFAYLRFAFFYYMAASSLFKFSLNKKCEEYINFYMSLLHVDFVSNFQIALLFSFD